MDRLSGFFESFKERGGISALPNGRKRVLYVDNCSGHSLSPAVREQLQKINTEVRFFPANATDLVQPADSFSIQKVKTVESSRWDAKKMKMILDHRWANGRTSSGKLANLGKTIF